MMQNRMCCEGSEADAEQPQPLTSLIDGLWAVHGGLPPTAPSSGGTSDLHKTWLLSESSPLPAPARIYNHKEESNSKLDKSLHLQSWAVHLRNTHLKDESGGSLFMTVRMRVRRPFFPSHTRLLSVLTRASTSGMLAFMDMALSSFSSWLFSSRYLFLKRRRTHRSTRDNLLQSQLGCPNRGRAGHQKCRWLHLRSLTRGDH